MFLNRYVQIHDDLLSTAPAPLVSKGTGPVIRLTNIMWVRPRQSMKADVDSASDQFGKGALRISDMILVEPVDSRL